MSKAGINGMTKILKYLRHYFAKDSDVIKTVNSLRPNRHGELALRVVPGAQQLVTDVARDSMGTFAIRTTGGGTPIGDGTAALMRVMGNNVHTGKVEESITMSVTTATRPTGQEAITATINEAAFKAAAHSGGTYSFTYAAGGWSADPESYGIEVYGTPVAGDMIVVIWTEENLGAIAVPVPEAFLTTGYNLYDHEAGCARVLKYNSSALFIVGGTFTSLQFSDTYDGPRTAVSVSSGYFTIAKDGWIWVEGGNATDTEIYMCWTDWVSGRDCPWAAYAEQEIDLSDLFTGNDCFFPWGLCRVGGTYDEIDLNSGFAYSRIERMANTAENLAAVIASGRDYDADTTYIYAVRTEPIVTVVDIDGTYTANDHGIELFEGTSVPVGALMIYGENLVDKLRTDVLTISQQTLTSTQQEQARENIGAASDADLTTLNNNFSTLSTQLSDNLLIKRIRLTAVTDLNSVPSTIGIGMNTGPYFVKFGQSASNAPTSFSGFVIGFAYTTNSEVQLALAAADAKIYTRSKSSGSWGEWKTFTGS